LLNRFDRNKTFPGDIIIVHRLTIIRGGDIKKPGKGAYFSDQTFCGDLFLQISVGLRSQELMGIFFRVFP